MCTESVKIMKKAFMRAKKIQTIKMTTKKIRLIRIRTLPKRK